MFPVHPINLYSGLFIKHTDTVIPVMNEVPVFTKIDREGKEGREDERKGKKGGTDRER